MLKHALRAKITALFLLPIALTVTACGSDAGEGPGREQGVDFTVTRYNEETLTSFKIIVTEEGEVTVKTETAEVSSMLGEESESELDALVDSIDFENLTGGSAPAPSSPSENIYSIIRDGFSVDVTRSSAPPDIVPLLDKVDAYVEAFESIPATGANPIPTN